VLIHKLILLQVKCTVRKSIIFFYLQGGRDIWYLCTASLFLLNKENFCPAQIVTRDYMS